MLEFSTDCAKTCPFDFSPFSPISSTSGFLLEQSWRHWNSNIVIWVLKFMYFMCLYQILVFSWFKLKHKLCHPFQRYVCVCIFRSGTKQTYPNIWGRGRGAKPTIAHEINRHWLQRLYASDFICSERPYHLLFAMVGLDLSFFFLFISDILLNTSRKVCKDQSPSFPMKTIRPWFQRQYVTDFICSEYSLRIVLYNGIFYICLRPLVSELSPKIGFKNLNAKKGHRLQW